MVNALLIVLGAAIVVCLVVAATMKCRHEWVYSGYNPETNLAYHLCANARCRHVRVLQMVCLEDKWLTPDEADVVFFSEHKS